MSNEKIGKMGWGDPRDNPTHTLYRERIAFEVASDLFTPFEVLQEQEATESPIEAELRQLMPFDKGWDFEYADKLIYGQHLTFQQNIGNCVGASHCMLLASKVAHEILIEGDPEEPLGDQASSPIPYVPYSYGAGRVYIGGNRINGDGSLCEWQIQATMEYGFLPSDQDGLTGVPQGSAGTGRSWGRSKATLDKWLPQAKAYDMESTPITSADQCRTALVDHKHPSQICSSWGFAVQRYDSKYDLNLYTKSGSWAHSMQVIAIFEKKGAWFVKIRNQWGETHKDGMSFVIPFELFERWIPQSSTATIGEIKGRPTNPGFEV